MVFFEMKRLYNVRFYAFVIELQQHRCSAIRMIFENKQAVIHCRKALNDRLLVLAITAQIRNIKDVRYDFCKGRFVRNQERLPYLSQEMLKSMS